MNRTAYPILFLLMVLVLCGCKKSLDSKPSSVFVKLFATDSIYQAGGCFQLPDGNYIIYGVYFNANDGSAPLIIKFDQSGKIIWQQPLSILFHYVTIKPISNGNMLAVGVENQFASSENVCIINSMTGAVIDSESYLIDSVHATRDYLPDFVEEDNGDFTILDGRSKNGYNIPFILRINSSCTLLKDTEYTNLIDGAGILPVSIVRNENGYSVTGNVLSKNEILFLRLDQNDSWVSDTLFSDETGTLSVAASTENKSGNSTIICGSYGTGTDLSGTLYVNSIDMNDNLGVKKSFFDYENLGKFEDINQTSDGGYILVATVNKLADHDLVSYNKIYLLKLRADLSTEWSHTFNSFNPYTAVSAVQTLDGGYLVGGYEHTTSYVYTMFVMKTDANGNIVTE